MAVTERFVLSSLMFFDLRAVLRDLGERTLMPPKPHRVLLDRVSGYADEAAAYLRRRRHMRKPFARVYYHRAAARRHLLRDTTRARRCSRRRGLIEIAGPPDRGRRPARGAPAPPASDP